MFVNILTADGKYSLLNKDKLRQPIQMQLSQKKKLFSGFVCAFLKAKLNFEHFQKKMTFIADILPKLQTPKNVVTQISKKSPFREQFSKEHVRGTKPC